MTEKKRPKKKLKRPGAPPGTLQFTGEQRMEHSYVSIAQYDPQHCDIRKMEKGETPVVGVDCVMWYDIRGLHDVALVETFGQHFNIHPLVLEDILHTQQRPKFEEYGDEVFIVVSALSFNQGHELSSEQVAIYFGENFLLTFQENEHDTFLAVRERLEVGSGRIRSRKADYLAYALIDNVVDNYFGVLDHIEDWLQELENEINKEPSREVKEKIHQLKFQLLALRRSVMPLREVAGKFSRCESKVMDKNTSHFVRDLYDHAIRISDRIETYRDMLTGLQELYIAELSIRTNNVIQVLTIITTIFVPLTFLAGIYGMNFDNMPELHWKNGYFYLLGLMGLILIASLFYFKRKRWI